MTVPATATAPTSTSLSPGVWRFSEARLIPDTLTMAWRSLITMVRNPGEFYDILIQPVMFTVLFGELFGGADSGALRPIRQIPDISLRLRQLQSVAIAAALDDPLPHDGTQPGDDDVQRPQGAGRGVVGPQGLDEGAVAHPGVQAAGEHGEQVKAPSAQGPALPGRRLRQESQAVRGDHGSILPHRREAVLHMPGPVAATVLVAAAARSSGETQVLGSSKGLRRHALEQSRHIRDVIVRAIVRKSKTLSLHRIHDSADGRCAALRSGPKRHPFGSTPTFGGLL